jgi:hypothetical protein
MRTKKSTDDTNFTDGLRNKKSVKSVDKKIVIERQTDGFTELY